MDYDEVAIEQRFKNTKNSNTFMHIVRTHKLHDKKVLDIGCSYGEFLIHFGEGSTGLTIAPDEAAFGATKGLDIRVGNIEHDDVPIQATEKYDVIFANNILEHLYSPHAFLLKLKTMLTEDGIIIIGVPCIPKIVSLWKFRKFRGSLAESHINFFTRQSLQKTIERAGWITLENRSFVFFNTVLDWFVHLVSPHLYVVAKNDTTFAYHPKRLKELAGYNINNG